MLILFAIVLVLHGVAHVVGVPSHTTLLDGAVDVGDTGMRVMGGLWLAAGLAFAVAGVAAIARAGWWPIAALFAAMFSFLLCVLAWPDARAGAVLDVALVAAIFVGMRAGWFDKLATP